MKKAASYLKTFLAAALMSGSIVGMTYSLDNARAAADCPADCDPGNTECCKEPDGDKWFGFYNGGC